MSYWFTRLVGLQLRDRRFRVHTAHGQWTTPVFGYPNVTAFFKAQSLHWFCSTCTPTTCQVTRGRKFIYADDMCLAIQGQYFRKLECSLSSDMARMSHFCRQWRLKPSASNTISSVFHLQNTSATHKLSVYLDGQCLRHECHQPILGWLDRTLSYREHLTKTAGKLKKLNNLLMKPVPPGCQHQWIFRSHLLWLFAIQQQSTAPQPGHAVLAQVTSMCSWTLPCASSLVPSILHLIHGFQCSPTLNRQSYKWRLPLTSWWRKSSNMTVGQSSLISLTHHCYD